MRTKLLPEFEKSISEVNNNLSHTIFVFSQFTLDNAVKIRTYPTDLTTTIYTENKLAPQFNVRLETIEEQAQQTLEYIFDSFFVFINTHFEVYLKDVYLFVKDNFNAQLPEPPDSKIYEIITASLGINVEADLDNVLVSTYDYFKLRRNAIMHRHKDKRFHGLLELLVTGGFKKDKKKKKLFREQQLNGQELNLHWKQYRERLKATCARGHVIQTLDFSSRDVRKFTANDLIDVFNFYRLYASKLDALILERIPRQTLLEYCATKFVDSYSDKKKFDFEQFSKKFIRTSIQELNLTPEEKELDKIYNGA